MRLGRFRRLGVGVLAAVLLAAKPHDTAVAAQPCERACLEGFVEQYLEALQMHDPRKASFADDVKFTENGQKLELGDGLWRTFTARGSYRMFVDDVEAGHVAFLGSIREADTPAMLALHLRVRKSKITAAETFVQRNEKSALGFEAIGYTWRELIPAGERHSRADLLRAANAYFSGMQQNDGKGSYPFDDESNRIENGVFTTNIATPFVSRVRDRRFVAIDPERGLVFSYVFFDHMAAVTAGPQQPWTWEIAQAFRLEHGEIHQVMAVMERVPYGMSSGWSTWEEGMSTEGREASR
jgi:hypothetical protein